MDRRNGTEALARRLLELKRETESLVAGITGSVASGKTTLAGEIEAILDKTHRAETISTDGFLFSNTILEERGQTLRKGFPETYDLTAMGDALEALAAGEAAFPIYSHVTYDVDPVLTRTIAQPDILILEGLGFRPLSPPPRHDREPDILIYLDATEDNLQTWFLERFVRYWNAARQDPSSFYANFLHMSEPELLAFATSVWEQINLPNLRQHIAPLRETADIVVLKDADHAIRITHDRIG
ncbi:nucleoside/nucleotide kinase family protein [Hyphomonas pacifica]|uniref:Phosphoribulokinase/uridine kinase domain-containing protein n=1 Tax=Hyphomonas pacifica TaxID=1280941 RepID=A0A062TZM8_9PROT|nr:type I pantothenate kinase [Hyphomonas pacifica]KCZ48428.1 hypothetical protein HY2_04265 [Hyphomonas pacifica]RAN31740.1 hypothetical protein HY3_03960 [Hyphomonas pacifica]RAN32133.1 hypothetical protein HY11_06025 [Hyphomonas pacifica]